MISTPCRKCGSVNIRKNGMTGAGAQKYHYKAWKFYGTLVAHKKYNKNNILYKDCSANACYIAGSPIGSV